MSMADRDAIVVGGGLAGLTAARELAQAGLAVTVLEASDRVGGRLLRQEVAGIPVDGGGAWVGPTQDRILALIQRFGLRTQPTWTRGRQIAKVRGRIRARSGDLPPVPVRALADVAIARWRLDRLARGTATRAPDRDLDRRSLGSWADKHLHTHAARALLDVAVATTTGAATDELSLLAFLRHVDSAGGFEQLVGVEGAAQDRRIVGGAVSVCERLAEELGEPVRLGARVSAVGQEDGRAIVGTEGDSLAANAVVVALDPSLRSRIDFGPGLPREQRSLQAGWVMGTGLKYHLAYRSPFWRERGLSGQWFADEGLARIGFDATPDGADAGVLVGFLGLADAGPDEAPLLEPGRAEDRRARICAELTSLFGDAAAESLDYVEQDWRSEPDIAGCVPAPPPGVLAEAGADTHRAWGRVFWAGAESAERWEGHMDGAARSGERAAAEVIAALGQRGVGSASDRGG